MPYRFPQTSILTPLLTMAVGFFIRNRVQPVTPEPAPVTVPVAPPPTTTISFLQLLEILDLLLKLGPWAGWLCMQSFRLFDGQFLPWWRRRRQAQSGQVGVEEQDHGSSESLAVSTRTEGRISPVESNPSTVTTSGIAANAIRASESPPTVDASTQTTLPASPTLSTPLTSSPSYTSQPSSSQSPSAPLPTIYLIDILPHLQCPICHDILLRPQMVQPCMHTFCQRCLARYVLAGHGRLRRCPYLWCKVGTVETDLRAQALLDDLERAGWVREQYEPDEDERLIPCLEGPTVTTGTPAAPLVTPASNQVDEEQNSIRLFNEFRLLGGPLEPNEADGDAATASHEYWASPEGPDDFDQDDITEDDDAEESDEDHYVLDGITSSGWSHETNSGHRFGNTGRFTEVDGSNDEAGQVGTNSYLPGSLSRSANPLLDFFCAVCRLMFIRPHALLSCRHMFCLRYINHLAREAGTTGLDCPSCRRRVLDLVRHRRTEELVARRNPISRLILSAPTERLMPNVIDFNFRNYTPEELCMVAEVRCCIARRPGHESAQGWLPDLRHSQWAPAAYHSSDIVRVASTSSDSGNLDDTYDSSASTDNDTSSNADTADTDATSDFDGSERSRRSHDSHESSESDGSSTPSDRDDLDDTDHERVAQDSVEHTDGGAYLSELTAAQYYEARRYDDTLYDGIARLFDLRHDASVNTHGRTQSSVRHLVGVYERMNMDTSSTAIPRHVVTMSLQRGVRSLVDSFERRRHPQRCAVDSTSTNMFGNPPGFIRSLIGLFEFLILVALERKHDRSV